MPDANVDGTTGWVVGQPGTLYVGVEGTVENVGDGLVTISGVTLPTRLAAGAPVRWLSTERPNFDEHEDCGWTDPDARYGEGMNDGRDEADREWVRLAREVHEAGHDGAFRWCSDRFCKMAVGRDG